MRTHNHVTDADVWIPWKETPEPHCCFRKLYLQIVFTLSFYKEIKGELMVFSILLGADGSEISTVKWLFLLYLQV